MPYSTQRRRSQSGPHGAKSNSRSLPVPDVDESGATRMVLVVVAVVVVVVLAVGAWWSLGSGSTIYIPEPVEAAPAPVDASTPEQGGEPVDPAGVPVASNPNNRPPKAEIRTSQQHHVIDFSGIFSDDPDGDDEDLRYQWDFGDGSTSKDGRGQHCYRDSGTFEVTLTVMDADRATDVATREIVVPEPSAELHPQRPIRDSEVAGLEVRRYRGEIVDLADMDRKFAPDAPGIDVVSSDEVVLSGIEPRSDHYALSFRGGLRVPITGLYLFALTSDDGSRLRLGNQSLITLDGHHGPKTGRVWLKLHAGVHELQVDYFQGASDRALSLEWIGAGSGLKRRVGAADLVRLP
ncbi:MAG: PKD domain-containing protein [Planctomycetota bacterium]|jgi:hypothetical protein|nr:PKD domain-containing protein [Planctomycetota bacterium]